MSKQISVRKLAISLGISPATVTYYTNLGLFKVVKVEGNKKLYNLADVTELYKKIQDARQKGYTLGLIKKLFDEGKSTK